MLWLQATLSQYITIYNLKTWRIRVFDCFHHEKTTHLTRSTDGPGAKWSGQLGWPQRRTSGGPRWHCTARSKVSAKFPSQFSKMFLTSWNSDGVTGKEEHDRSSLMKNGFLLKSPSKSMVHCLYWLSQDRDVPNALVFIDKCHCFGELPVQHCEK